MHSLKKLQIKAYRDEALAKAVADGEFTALFNPTEYTRVHETLYNRGATFRRNRPGDLKLKLILDGTGSLSALPGVLAPPSAGTVDKKVEAFMKLAHEVDGETHQPHFLRVSWGTLSFPCRLKSVTIHYTLFDTEGAPLRAELEAIFAAHTPPAAKPRLSSPDMTHQRVLAGGESLPLLSDRVYDDPAHYILLAKANDLDSFRGVPAGTPIICPPLERRR